MEFVMAIKGKLKVGCLTLLSFLLVVALIIYAFGSGFISRTEGFLMAIMLLGMYVGFGVLIVSYRFVTKLDDE
jgi:ABC-type maltose transport system permease subunit|tara:strand:- start:56 stop:274 length:219 start_codon:yes stop_codon:yes gene_type:complete